METPAPAGEPAEDGELERDEFPAFPYSPPYDIQVAFMRALYRALERGGVGFFESPTGTGKTLSLIVGALHWLQDRRAREAARLEAAAGGGGGSAPPATAQPQPGADAVPDWVLSFTAEKEAKRRREAEERRAARLDRARAKLAVKAAAAARQLGGARRPAKAAAGAAAAGAGGAGEDDEFLMDEWRSDDEGGGVGAPGAGAPAAARARKRAAAAAALLASSGSDSSGDEPLGEAELEALDAPPPRQQVVFTSRTHSQLAQVVGELHRTPFADSTALVALGARRALCINDAVLRLGSPALINERCLELQKPGSGGAKAARAAPGDAPGAAAKPRGRGGCPYLAAGSRAAAAMQDIVLAQPMDVEELARLGRRRGVCPYYAARRALPHADVVLAPYGSLLTAEAREGAGLSLAGAALIVDEAHNLGDAINGAHAAELGEPAAAAAGAQLRAYLERFRARLAPGNARHVQALAAAADALARAAATCAAAAAAAPAGPASGAPAAPPAGGVAVTVNDFLFSCGLDNVNMLRLVRYCRESKAVFKVAGFWAAQQARAAAAGGAAAAPPPPDGGATGALHALVAFLRALTNDDADGRVIVDAGARRLRFVLLNAAAHWAGAAAEARAVVLASGTLSPLGPVLRLFPGLPPGRAHHFSCGHVVGRDRLLALAVGRGPGGGPLDFRHGARASGATLDELGRALAGAAAAAPGGAVVFLPSFAYAEAAAARWRATGALDRLGRAKRLFTEPRAAADVEPTLAAYAAAATAPGGRGALLLCVVGGKLAEGINFGDDLGRLVVLVGLPYPNAGDAELRERLAAIDRAEPARRGAPPASRAAYTDLAMRAANQCVGRAIRHARDYAAVLLLDARWAAGAAALQGGGSGGGASAAAGPVAKLPGWVRGSLVAAAGWGDAYAALVRFYKAAAAREGGGGAPAEGGGGGGGGGGGAEGGGA